MTFCGNRLKGRADIVSADAVPAAHLYGGQLVSGGVTLDCARRTVTRRGASRLCNSCSRSNRFVRQIGGGVRNSLLTGKRRLGILPVDAVVAARQPDGGQLAIFDAALNRTQREDSAGFSG